MLPTKTKTGLMETSPKSTPATSKNGKLSRTPSRSSADSHSPLQSSRPSIERSPRSGESKPNVDRRSPKLGTTADRLMARTLKDTDLQAQVNAAQDDLKKAKNRLVFLEKEKAQALEELAKTKRQADEANDKLSEVLVALRKAEEETEIERFRTIELEQAGLEAAQQSEEVWEKEIETVRNQHALDVSALFTTTQELQRVQQELAMITEAKNTAIAHADDAMKIAENNAEKVEILNAEIARLKLSVDSKLEKKTNKDDEEAKKIELEVNTLRCELEKAMEAQKRLTEMETLIEGLRIEVADSKKAESDMSILADEWKKKAELLEVKVVEAIQSEHLSSEALSSVKKQLDECNTTLEKSASEIASLKEKVKSLELMISRHKADFDNSERHLEMSKQEVLEMKTTIEILKSEIHQREEEKILALENEKQLVGNLHILEEEKKQLLYDLENSREEVEHSKKAMDDLASALHEVSTETRELKERLLIQQTEAKDDKRQIDELSHIVKSTEVSYMAMLSDAKDEIVHLEADVKKLEMDVENARADVKKSEIDAENAWADVKKSEMDAENARANWSRKEQSFLNSIKKSQEEVDFIKAQLEETFSKLQEAKLEAVAAKEDADRLLASTDETKIAALTATKAAEEANTKNMRLKEVLLDKENELQSISQENDDIRSREEAALKKIDELSRLLDEATTKNMIPNGKLTDEANDSVSPPNTLDLPDDERRDSKGGMDTLIENGHINTEDNHKIEDNDCKPEEAEPFEIVADDKKQEDHEVVDKESSPEMELESESVADEMGLKVDSESLQHLDGLIQENLLRNGGSPPSKEKQQKKKKAILSKFGSLLKKKNSPK